MVSSHSSLSIEQYILFATCVTTCSACSFSACQRCHTNHCSFHAFLCLLSSSSTPLAVRLSAWRASSTYASTDQPHGRSTYSHQRCGPHTGNSHAFTCELSALHQLYFFVASANHHRHQLAARHFPRKSSDGLQSAFRTDDDYHAPRSRQARESNKSYEAQAINHASFSDCRTMKEDVEAVFYAEATFVVDDSFLREDMRTNIDMRG